MALNPDAGEMVGWPHFTETVANVYESISASRRGEAVISTGNYGEAGAIAHFGPTLTAIPTQRTQRMGALGSSAQLEHNCRPHRHRRAEVRRYFTGCRLRTRIDNGYGLKNNEQHEPVWLCTGEVVPWASLWPALRHYD